MASSPASAPLPHPKPTPQPAAITPSANSTSISPSTNSTSTPPPPPPPPPPLVSAPPPPPHLPLLPAHPSSPPPPTSLPPPPLPPPPPISVLPSPPISVLPPPPIPALPLPILPPPSLPSPPPFLQPPSDNPQSSSPSKAPPFHPSSSANATPRKSSNLSVPMLVLVATGVVVLVILLLALAFYLCKKKKNKNKKTLSPRLPDIAAAAAGLPKWNNVGQDGMARLPPPPGYSGLLDHPTTPQPGLGFIKSAFSYEELLAATDGFSNENILGQGGFGYVHKGVLASGEEVAVKQLKAGSGQGEREFQAEVEIISRVHHRHLVSLVGYCILGPQRLLVYEFVSNKTLEFHLHGKNQPTMDWPTRMRIALGSAKGLAYLHEDCHPRIIHRDIKASNILLDDKFEAKVADFGLAKLSSDNYTHVSTRVMGTFGYLAPEYASSGKLTEKSDVFSFGVMLLELIAGRRPVDSNPMEDSLVDWARPLLTLALSDEKYEELVDPRLEGDYSKLEMARMVACAATSVRHSAKMRPKMSQIVRALEGDSSLEDLTEGVKPGQSMILSSSSDHDSESYASNASRFRRRAFESNELSQEYSGLTSDYGLNPSSSSSSSGEIDAALYHSGRGSIH